jgi:hypothetical protein
LTWENSEECLVEEVIAGVVAAVHGPRALAGLPRLVLFGRHAFAGRRAPPREVCPGPGRVRWTGTRSAQENGLTAKLLVLCGGGCGRPTERTTLLHTWAPHSRRGHLGPVPFRRRCRRGARQASVECGWMCSWTPRWAVDVHKNVRTNVHSLLFDFVVCVAQTRAVKGGAAEASDMSAPSLDGPGSAWTQWSRPGPPRP